MTRYGLTTAVAGLFFLAGCGNPVIAWIPFRPSITHERVRVNRTTINDTTLWLKSGTITF